MLRAEALKRLSREHHEALVLARHASATAANPHSAAARAQHSHLLERWAQQFEPHFALEEQTLLPALARAGHHARRYRAGRARCAARIGRVPAPG